MIKTLHSEWQTAFAEWHLHRTDECAELEKTARQNYLSLIREMRKAKVKSRRVNLVESAHNSHTRLD